MNSRGINIVIIEVVFGEALHCFIRNSHIAKSCDNRR